MKRYVEMEKERERVMNKNATKVQSAWRMVLGKRGAFHAKKEKAATDINKHARRLFATRVVRIKKDERKRKETTALLLQRCWRGTIVRMERVAEEKEKKRKVSGSESRRTSQLYLN